MTKLTKKKPDDTRVPPEMDAFLRADNIVQAINDNLPAGAVQLPPIPKEYVFRKHDVTSVSAALHGAFELMGGVPALVHWAKNNPDKFMPLYAKLLGAEGDGKQAPTTIIVQSAIPQSPLDMVTIDETGKVVTLSSEDDIPE